MGLLVHRQQRGLCLLSIYQEVKVFIKIILMYAQILALVNSLYAICSVSQSLPNCSGQVKNFVVDYNGNYVVSGAFASISATVSTILGHNGTGYSGKIKAFDMTLSRSNEIYNGSKVIPTSRKCLFLIKY